MSDTVLLPDGRPFHFWDDVTEYSHTYHVASEHPAAADDNPGTEDRPFATIGRAAGLLKPGEKVLVRRGIYREWVRPARGGSGPAAMIWYQAAPGETVIVRGSEVLRGPFLPSAGWRAAPTSKGRVWMADLPGAAFGGFNPFMANNMSAEFSTFNSDWTQAEVRRQQRHRGKIFVDGQPLVEVHFFGELGQTKGAFWVEEPGLRVHFSLWNDADPANCCVEFTAREQAFAPQERRLGYVRVSGFTFEHGADPVPVPQRALLSATRGHHWIIEDNRVRHANATGIDVGNESWHAVEPDAGEAVGGHILRRNHISNCGMCGVAGVMQVDGTLVENNLIEDIGGADVERIWESGGLKFHCCESVLIRRNVFRHMVEAPGIWLDYLNRNTRITENVFYDIYSLHAAIYLEVSHAPNVIDHNLIWDVRKPRITDAYRYGYGAGILVDTGEEAVVANNLIGQVRDLYAISADLVQEKRIVGGRVGLGRRHKILNNLVVRAAGRILLSRAEENTCEGNLYDAAGDATSFCVQYPAPQAVLDLQAWQAYYGFDRQGGQTEIVAEFNPEKLEVTLEVRGDIPAGAAVPEIGQPAGSTPGPFPLRGGKRTYRLFAAFKQSG